MLATLALIAAVGTQSTLEGQVIKRADKTYESPTIHETQVNVPDPNDPTKLVSAQVTYAFRYRIVSGGPVPDDYQVTRTVKTRPESPARSFTMQEMRLSPSTEDQEDSSEVLSDAFDAAIKEGCPPSIGPTLHQGIEAMRNRTKEDVNTTPQTINPNERIRSGGWTIRTYGYHIYHYDIAVDLVKTVKVAGQDKPTETVTQFGRYGAWDYWVPAPLLNEMFYPDQASNQMTSGAIPSGFGGLKFSDEYAGLLGMRYALMPRIEANYDITSGKKTCTARQYQDDVIATLPENRRDFWDLIDLTPNVARDMLNATAGQGVDMNSLSVPGDPGTLGMPKCGSELSFPVGTIWVPDRAGYQTMTNTTPANINFAIDASTDGGSVSFQDIRTHCLNMNLKMPAKGVRYFPYMSNDEVIEGLAQIANASNFRGPWDQVRTWIYTDKASLYEANERISPPVSEGQYANGLFDVHKLGGLTAADLKSKKLFEPRLLASAGTNEQAFEWLAMHMGETFGAEVRKWLESSPSDLTQKVVAPNNDFEREQVPRLMRALTRSLNKDARMGALNFLDKLRDGERALKDKVGDFHTSLYSPDPREVELAKKVAARYGE